MTDMPIAEVARQAGVSPGTLVRRPAIDIAGSQLEVERVAEVTLEGFSGPTELFPALGVDD